MIFAIFFLSFLIIATFALLRLNKSYAVLALCKRVQTIDGTPLDQIAPVSRGRTIFGNTFDMISMNPVQLFYSLRENAATIGQSYLQYILCIVVYNIIDAADAELVLNEPTLITKSILYKFLEPFLKKGLLTSTDKKWHARRKLLTPAFHFKILGQFEEIFKQESEKFVKNLKSECIDNQPLVVSLNERIPRFTLNTVCETALGVQLDDRLDGNEYRENLTKVEESCVKRIINPFYVRDWIYSTFGDRKEDAKYLKKLHAFSSGIIEKRRTQFETASLNSANAKDDAVIDENDIIYNKKQRYAMLDTLLLAEKDGLIDHAGICEEVDTFMFEGFDTTSMNLIFGLMNLSLYPEMQQRCYEEIKTHISDDLSKIDIAQLNQLKYLDCFIKETQRLYPSVPVVFRENMQETVLANKLVLPKGTQFAVHIFDLHRNPKYWDAPNEFRPERFFPENSIERHPFAFVPFSAGQRNCIGQKFAMLEIKTLLVFILKNFKLLPVSDPGSFRFICGILIRSDSKIIIKVVKR